jgi:hypothetical protein
MPNFDFRTSFPHVRFYGEETREPQMIKSLLVATCIAAISTLGVVGASAQTGGSANQEGSTSAKDKMDKDGMMRKDGPGATTGTSPSAKDSSTQGAGTAGAAEKKGDAAAPGGTMKK